MTPLDVAVIGAGGAGFSAALTSADAGARSAIFEAADVVGGTYAFSAGQVWAAGTRQEHEAGIADSNEEGLQHVRSLSAGRHDESILQVYMNELPGVLDYFENRFGIRHEVIRNFPDYYAEAEGGKAEGRYLVPRSFNRSLLPAAWRDRVVLSPTYKDIPADFIEVLSWGGFTQQANWDWDMLAERKKEGIVGFGSATIARLLLSALELAVPVNLEHKLTGLEPQGGLWNLTFESPAGTTTVLARNVVLATGGYDHSARLRGIFDQAPQGIAAGMDTVTGDAIVLALENGASFAPVSGQIQLPTGHMEGEYFRGQPVQRLFHRETALPGGLIVNRSGKRFADESFYRDIVNEMNHLDARTQTYPNGEAFLVIDQAARDKYWLGSIAPGQAPDWLTTGESLRELAGKIGVDPEGLERTVERFNHHAQAGQDPDFHRGELLNGRAAGDVDVTPNPTMRPLADGTVYAIQVYATSVGSSGGLRFDTNGRVLDWRDRPVEGLYCAGNAGAGLVEGLWYNSGVANGRGLLFGHRSALDALERSRVAAADG